MNEKLPPCSIDAEEALLGCVLFKPDLIAELSKTLPVEAFFVGSHQTIYQSMVYVHHRGYKPDLIALFEYVRSQNIEDAVGGYGKLSQLLNRTISATNYDRYAQLIMDKYQRRRLIALGSQITELGYDETQELQDIYDEIRSLLPDSIMVPPQDKKPYKIKSVRYSQYSQDKSQKLEMEAEVLEGFGTLNATAKLAAEVESTAEKLWSDKTN